MTRSCRHGYRNPDTLAPTPWPTYDLCMNRITRLPVDEIVLGHRRRPLNLAHVADLADSITTIGLLQSLVVTRENLLVAGRHRLEAVKRLGWATVPVTMIELSDIQSDLATLDENLVRNDLSRLERFEHVVRRVDLLDALGHRKVNGRPRKADTVSGFSKGTDDLAAESGLSGRTLQRATSIVSAIPEDVREMLKKTLWADSTTELLRLSRLAPSDQKAVAERLVAGDRGAVNDLFLAVKRQRRQEEATRLTARQGTDDENVHVGSFEKLGHVMPDGTVALFLADPPYAEVPIYGKIAHLAAQKLRPGGWLAAYYSTHLLGEVMRHLGDHLQYYWTIAIRCTAVSKQSHAFRVRTGWKGILIFQKQPRTKPPDWLNDFYAGDGAEKDHHRWEQPVTEARYLIERLTNPGDWIADVTCGSGSSLVAAKLASRRWIGIDADPDAASVARLRLRESNRDPAQ